MTLAISYSDHDGGWYKVTNGKRCLADFRNYEEAEKYMQRKLDAACKQIDHTYANDHKGYNLCRKCGGDAVLDRQACKEIEAEHGQFGAGA